MNLNPVKQFFIKQSDTISCFQQSFQQSELLYVKANRSYSILYFEGQKTIKICKPMCWLIEQIEKGLLIKCHKSFAVNRQNIQFIDIDNRIILLKNDISVSISIRELQKLKKLNKINSK